MKEVRESVKGILLLDAGDLLFKKFSISIPENELKVLPQKAHLIIESFNLMGYDAMGIGDDDLSLGKEFLVEISKRANFPFLSSNLIDEETGKLLFRPYLIKEVNGLRIGIFALLSPDVFLSQFDLRRKGLVFRQPIETAREMVKELQSKTDLIILLSHLSYPKDLELAQSVPGIHLIVGSHTGVNLSYPSVFKNTIILQMAARGMYGGRLDLNLHNNENNEPTFYNAVEKQSLQNGLNSLKNRLDSPEIPEAQKVQWRKAKEEIERKLQQLQGKNEFTNNILPLYEHMKEHPDILKMVDEYKIKYLVPGSPPSSK